MEIETMNEDNDGLESMIETLVEIEQRKTDKIEQLYENLLKEQNVKLQIIKSEIANLAEIDERKKDEIAQLKESLRQEQAAENLSLSLKVSIEKISRLKLRLNELETQNLSKEAEIQQLSAKLNKVQRILATLKEDKERLEIELVKMEKKKTDDIGQLSESLTQERAIEYKLQSNLTSDCDLPNDIREKSKHNQGEVFEQTKMTQRVEEEQDEYCEPWCCKKQTVTVQMYTKLDKPLSDNIMDELAEWLRMQFRKINTLLVVQKYQNPPEDSRLPLIIVCMKVSRLDVDVKPTLKTVSDCRTTALVLLHHTQPHAIIDMSDSNIFSEREYKHIHDIVPMAYVTDRGIYQCDTNTESLKRLVDFIKNHQ